MEMEVDTKEGRKLVGASLGGILAHGLLCPFHGLPGILVTTGIISAGSLGPITYAHDFILKEGVEPIVSQIVQDPIQAEHISHITLDYVGTGLGIGIPLAYLGTKLYQRFRK